jgi:LuxR family maltose regulon positive regulatory protein
MREFLLKTAILERLTGPLCDALTGKQNGGETLEGLNRSNLFVVPMDHQQTWYRYHHLFAELLQSQLLHACPQLVLELHRQASQWYEENGWLDEAINHAFDAREFDRASRLICQNAFDVIYNRSISALERWLNAFPEAFLMADPRLCIVKSHWLHASGQDAGHAVYVQQAQNLLHEGLASGKYSENDPEIKRLLGEVCSFQSMQAIARNDFPEAVALSQKAVATIPETSRARAFALGGLYVAYQLLGNIPSSAQVCSEAIAIARKLNYPSMHATATYTLAQALRIQGRLQQAIEVVREALDYTERKGQANLFYSGFLRVSLAESFYERNALDEMEAELETGLKLCYQGGMNILCMIGLYTRIQLLHARGEIARALEAIDHIEHECRHMDFNIYLEDCRFYRSLLQAEAGETVALRNWLNQADLAVGEVVGVERFGVLRRILQVCLLLERGDEALPALKKLEKIAFQQNYRGWLIPILAMEAVAWKQKRNDRRSLDCLEQALALAEPEGYRQAFISLSEPMRDLLCMLQKQGSPRPFVARLLAGFASQTSAQTAPARPDILSKREAELLGLIASGRSNKEIAAELVISIGTVKRHTVNIFTKLDVKNRTEAVAKARELGLL